MGTTFNFAEGGVGIWVVLIHNETKRKGKRRTCGHRHTDPGETVRCRDRIMEAEPQTNVCISRFEDAPQFLFPPKFQAK